MFWTKVIWIIHIHRPSPVGHWVLCTAFLSHHELHLFDSLTKENLQWVNVQVCILTCIGNNTNYASERVYEVNHLTSEHHQQEIYMSSGTWDSRSDHYLYDITYSFSQTEHLQTNDYDCGLWVLATVVAIYWGHDTAGLMESDMLAFWYYLQACVLLIPIA